MSKKIADRLRDPLEDQGWQQMKVLLNREMPESRRKVIWWPWIAVAATLALLLLGYQYMIKNAEQPLFAGSPIPESPILFDQGQTNSPPDVLIDSAPSKSELSESGISKSDKASAKDLPSIIKNQNQNENITPLRSMLANQENVGGDNDPKLEHGKDKKVITNLTDSSLHREVIAYVDPKGAPKADFQILTPLVPLLSSVRYTYPIRRNEWLEPMTMEDIIEVKGDAKIDFSLSTGMLTDNTVSKPSFDLGGQIRLVPSGKIAIGLGSFFWSINSNQSFSAVAAPTNSFTDSKDFTLSADQEMQRADSASVPQAGLRYYTGQINNLAYLRVPVFIQFFPAGKWQPYIGASQNILLSDGSQGLLESDASRDFATVGSGANTTQPISDLVRMSNTAFLIGFTFQTHKHLAIDLAYAHSRLSYLNYDVSKGDFYEYHRFLRISLAYRF